MDRVADFFSQKTPRRLVALLAFATIIYSFRQLAILVVFFVTFERALSFCSRAISARTGLSRKKSVLIVLAAGLVLVGILAWLGIGKTIRVFASMQNTFPEKLAELKDNGLVARFEEEIGGTEKIINGAREYAGSAISAASAVGHFVVYVVMGLILALVYNLESEEIDTFWSRVDRRSIPGTLARWLGFVADATVVTVQLQLVVAACNTLMTLPVLLLIGVPNIGALMLLIFVSALVPVIGNIVSGVTLSLLAYQQKGWLGVGIFMALTAILNKIESYYLNPKLTARHVKMPGFLLIVSLIACEHLFGFTGLFLSFPILFIAAHIRADFVEEDTGISASPIDLSDSPSQLIRDTGPSLDSSPGLAIAMELETDRVLLDSIRPPARAPEEKKKEDAQEEEEPSVK